MQKNAGAKVKVDAKMVLLEEVILPINIPMHNVRSQKDYRQGIVKKMESHWKVGKYVEYSLQEMMIGDTLILQLPLVNGTLFCRPL